MEKHGRRGDLEQSGDLSRRDRSPSGGRPGGAGQRRPRERRRGDALRSAQRLPRQVLAEMPEGLTIKRDYDISLPALVGDKEQLIQAMLNIVRNAAQAMEGNGLIVLRT